MQCGGSFLLLHVIPEIPVTESGIGDVMCLHSDWCKSVGAGNVFGWWHLFDVPVWIATEASAG